MPLSDAHRYCDRVPRYHAGRVRIAVRWHTRPDVRSGARAGAERRASAATPHLTGRGPFMDFRTRETATQRWTNNHPAGPGISRANVSRATANSTNSGSLDSSRSQTARSPSRRLPCMLAVLSRRPVDPNHRGERSARRQVCGKLAVFIRLWRKLKESCCFCYSFAQLRDICNVPGPLRRQRRAQPRVHPPASGVSDAARWALASTSPTSQSRPWRLRWTRTARNILALWVGPTARPSGDGPCGRSLRESGASRHATLSLRRSDCLPNSSSG